MEDDGKYNVEQDLMTNQIFPDHVVAKAHSNSIESLSCHPNGKTFATGSHDKTIKLWDAGSLKESMVLADHKYLCVIKDREGVWSLDYNHDGHMLASGSPDQSVFIWDSKKQSPGIKINAHKGKVYCVKFNQTGKILASAGENGQIFFWDLAKTDKPIKTHQFNQRVIYDLDWSKDGSSIFATTFGSDLLSFDAKSLELLSQVNVTDDTESRCECCAANFTFDNDRVFCGTSRGSIAWYSVGKGGKVKKQTEFKAHLDGVRVVKYHPSKKILISSSRDGSVRLWNARGSKHPLIAANLVAHQQNVPAASFLGQDLVVTGSWDVKLALWKVAPLLQ